LSMRLPDYRQAELEARSTSGSSFRTAAALGLLAASQLAVSPDRLPEPEPVIAWLRIQSGQTSGTSAEILSLRVVEVDPMEITYPLVPRGRATVVAHRGVLPPFSWDF
jgi:hypothetical protein